MINRNPLHEVTRPVGHVNGYKHFCPFSLDRVTDEQTSYWIAIPVT